MYAPVPGPLRLTRVVAGVLFWWVAINTIVNLIEAGYNHFHSDGEHEAGDRLDVEPRA